MIVVIAALTRLDQSIRVRGETRSDRTPPTSRNTPRGRAAASSTVPSASPDPVRPRTSQDSAT